MDRNALFDYAKGIGIILVVYGHVARGIQSAGLPVDQEFHTLVDSVIYSFHMPLFFFISGCFFPLSVEKRGAVGLLAGKLSTVVYPYILWSLLQGLLEVAVSAHTNGSVTLDQVLSLLWWPRAQFWFLYILFGAFVLAAVLYRQTTPAWTTMVLGLAIAYYLTRYSPADMFMLNVLPQCFVFFACGVSAAHLLTRVDLGRPGWLALTAAAFVLAQWDYHQDVVDTASGHTSPAKLVLGLLGIGLVMLLSRHLTSWRWRWLEYVGRHSLEIYLLHVLAGSGTRIVLQQFLGITDPVAHLVAGTLAGLGLPLLLVANARRPALKWLFAVSPPLRSRQA
jgi:fucose 4-O-acetylase-like acetyltransferase